MGKTSEELQELKEKIETLSSELAELTDEEMEQIAGGVEMCDAEREFREAVEKKFKEDLRVRTESGEITSERAKALANQFDQQHNNAIENARTGRRNTNKQADAEYQRFLFKLKNGLLY